MNLSRRGAILALVAPLALAACGGRKTREAAKPAAAAMPLQAGETPQMRALVRKYAQHHGIPESLLHRVIQRESRYNPGARNGPYYGLMQIHPSTARTMGYTGAPEGLLNPETNLQYAGKYLRGAWLVSDGSQDRAVMWYSKGYYYEAKKRGLLKETGLKS